MNYMAIFSIDYSDAIISSLNSVSLITGRKSIIPSKVLQKTVDSDNQKVPWYDTVTLKLSEELLINSVNIFKGYISSETQNLYLRNINNADTYSRNDLTITITSTNIPIPT